MELDLHYTDPRLADLYDLENVWGPDNDSWLELADKVGAWTVIDLGCGTGLITRALAVGDRVVIGVDPSPAMLAVARNGPGVERVRWIQGDASALWDIGADLALPLTAAILPPGSGSTGPKKRPFSGWRRPAAP